MLLTSLNSAIYGNSNKDQIILHLDGDNIIMINFNYYNGEEDPIFEEKGTFDLKVEKDLVLDISKQEFDKLIIEILENDELVFEAIMNIKEIDNKDDFIIDIKQEYNEVIDYEYDFINGIEISLNNHYYFNKLDNLLLPKIFEIDKMQISYDEYQSIECDNAYLLFDTGFKNSDLEKQDGFYKVPLTPKIIDNNITFKLSKEYYYDFNKGALKIDKTNNSVKVNDLVLSRNDGLVKEGYLVIEKFGFEQKKINIDLLLEEQTLFGETGYYKIKKIS